MLWRCGAAFLSFLAALIVFGGPCFAEDAKMRFTAFPPKPNQGNLWSVYADGTIDADAATRLRQFLTTNNIPRRSTLYLNSGGGIVQVGMEIGQTIRNAGLLTGIAKAANGRIGTGECYSACTLAFLGGVYRSIDANSRFGVHRFFGSEMTGDNAQIVSASIVQYIGEMGVDTRLFSEMTSAGATQINILTHDKMRQLRVTNDSINTTGWTVESSEHFVFVKGQRETTAGVQKFLLTCNASELWAYVTFDPNGRADEAVKDPLASFQIDNQSFHIAKPDIIAPPHLSNGAVTAIFRVDPSVRARLFKAKTVGIKLQTGYESPAFDGFVQMDFSGAVPKLGGALKQFSG